MNMKIARIVFYSFIIVTLAMSGCSDKSASKQEFIDIYNEFSKNSPPTIGEGVYPLTADFTTADKGKEGKAQALVDIGFLSPVNRKNSSKKEPDTLINSIVTFQITELGNKYYDRNVSGFVWGYNSAYSVSNVKLVTSSGQKTAYVTLKTKIINIPNWAKLPVIQANYPLVKESLNKNDFLFNAVYKQINNKWSMIEANQAVR
jgi:hypothetical protein